MVEKKRLNLLHELRTALAMLAGVTLLLVAGGAASADETTEMQRLVVLVAVQFDGGANLSGGGTGIVFAATPEHLYVVTAAHVVRAQGRNASDIGLQFGDGRPVVHAGLGQFDADLDVAVLIVDRPLKAGVNVDNLPFDRLAAGAARRGNQVFMMGRRGERLSVNVTPDRISSVSDRTIAIETNFIVKGFSGGALFDDRWQLLGMIVSDDPPEGTARPMPAILAKLQGWGLAPDLRVPHVRVAGGSHVSCRLDPGGSARCWGGLEFDEQLLSDERLSIAGVQWVSLSVGLHNLCGVDVAGAAWCLGQNPKGQLGNGTAVASTTSAVRVAGGLTFRTVSVGGHSCGITTTDGAGWCWGQGDEGQLGNDSNAGSTVPVQVSGALTLQSVSAGLLHSCAISLDGRAWCWGSNELAEFADKKLLVVHKPLAMAGDMRYKAIAAGYTHTCALAIDGAAYCWGQNEHGQLGDGTHDDHRSPVRVLGEHRYVSLVTAITGGSSCGLTAEGVLGCWGLNNFGQLGNGSKSDSSSTPVAVSGGLRFVSISAGRFHGCGVTGDDVVWCWGGFGGLGSIVRDEPSRVPVRVDQ